MKEEIQYKSIDAIICDYLDQKNKNTATVRGNGCWPASNLGKCKRYQLLCRKGTPSPDGKNKQPYKWKNNAEDGHSSHTWRQSAIEKMGVFSMNERMVADVTLNYRGHYDLIVMLEDGLTLCDIKNQNSAAFKRRQKLPGKVPPDHKMQLCSYYHFLKTNYNIPLVNARMYYINRDSGEREEIIVHFDQEYIEEMLDELKYLNKCWDNNILPPKEVGVMCKNFCQFYEICTKLGDVQRTIPSTNENQSTGLQRLPAVPETKVPGDRTGKS
jgi:CRISPR/Cas system-associated exonuclease Cas4 (RecB family)